MRRGLLELVAPSRCVGCGARGAVPWCPPCTARAAMLRRRGGCSRCAGSCGSDDARCPLADTGVQATRAAFTYTGLVARTIVAAKVGGHHACWRPLGDLLGGILATAPPPVDVVVPVATEPRRARRRGFDHAALVADGVAVRLGLPTRRWLRTRPGTPDRGRQHPGGELPASAIGCRVGVTGVRVLLVDDVLTTGATVRAAVSALRAAGAAGVYVGVLARAGR